MLDRPDRMFANGCSHDQLFDLDERLFRRFMISDIRDGKLQIDQLPFYPAMSVNREKYSEAGDVLCPSYDGLFGVFAFQVKHIPHHYPLVGDIIYEWSPVHDPEEDNFAHTEVRTYKNKVFSKDIDIGSKFVKKWFRECLLVHIDVVIPSANSSTASIRD